MKNNKKNKSYKSPAAKLIGFHVRSARRGCSAVTLKTLKRHENSIGTVHGGILCDISDAAMGYAFESMIPKDRRGVTVEFKINFLRPVFSGDAVTANAKIISHGNTLYYLECEILNVQKELVAKAASTCKILSCPD